MLNSQVSKMLKCTTYDICPSCKKKRWTEETLTNVCTAETKKSRFKHKMFSCEVEFEIKEDEYVWATLYSTTALALKLGKATAVEVKEHLLHKCKNMEMTVQRNPIKIIALK